LLVGAGVRAGCDDASFRKPLGSRDGGPGHPVTAAEISRGIAPQPRPPSTDQDYVTDADDDFGLLRCSFQVGRGYAVARREVVATEQFRHVEQHPPGQQRRNLLGAVLAKAPATLGLRGIDPAMQQPVLAGVSESINVRTDVPAGDDDLARA
jgi:hypothetical protein